MNTKINNKTKGRELVFKFIYNLLSSKSEDEFTQMDDLMDGFADFEESYTEPDSEHPDNQIGPESHRHALLILNQWFNSRSEIKELITKYSKIKHLDQVTTSLLMASLAEMMAKQTPEKVVFDEFIDMAKKYGASGCHALVNAVLNSALSEIGKGK